MKTKQIRRLRHQFGRLTRLPAEKIALLLEQQGLIVICDDGTRYFETQKMRDIPTDNFYQAIGRILEGGEL
jgi:hypothetical protein